MSALSTGPNRGVKHIPYSADVFPSRPSRLEVYGVAVLVGLVLSLYAVILKHKGGDFMSLYLADARQLRELPIYWLPPEANPDNTACPDSINGFEPPHLLIDDWVKLASCYHPNLNPPVFIFATTPLAYLGFDAAWLTWFFFSMLCLSVAVRRLQQEHLIGQGRSSFLYAGLACLLYVPTLASFFFGQVTFQILLPIILGWSALRRGHDRIGGGWLGLAASLKPFVALFLLGLIILGNGRAIKSMMLTGLMCIALGWLGGGWSAYRDYFAVLHTVTWHSASWNASLAGFFSRLLGGSQNVPWVDVPELAHAVTVLSSLVVLAVFVLSVRRIRSRVVTERVDALMALCLSAMLLVSPLGWLYYFPFLLPCTLILWRVGGTTATPRRYRQALLMTLILSSMPSWLIPSKQMNDPLDWFGASGFYTVALLQLFGLAALYVQQSVVPSSR